MLIYAGEEFDRKNDTLDEDYERAIDHVELFVDWIWIISKNKVGETNFLIWSGDAETSKYSDQCHKYCIMGSTNTVENDQPSTSDSTDVLFQLTEGISRQNERIEETNKLARQEFDRKKEKDDENKDRMLKLHSSFLKMFLITYQQKEIGRPRRLLPHAVLISVRRHQVWPINRCWYYSENWVSQMSVCTVSFPSIS